MPRKTTIDIEAALRAAIDKQRAVVQREQERLNRYVAALRALDQPDAVTSKPRGGKTAVVKRVTIGNAVQAFIASRGNPGVSTTDAAAAAQQAGVRTRSADFQSVVYLALRKDRRFYHDRRRGWLLRDQPVAESPESPA